MSVLLHICLGTTHVPGVPRGQKMTSSSRTEVADICESPCSCQELNPGPLEDQKELPIMEPSLQPPLPPSLFEIGPCSVASAGLELST